VAKPNKDRRAVLDQMRREQERAEKKRTMAIIAGASAVGLLIVGAAAYPLLTRPQAEQGELAALGAPVDAAGCQDPKVAKAKGSADHRDIGTDLSYPDSPPAAGPHYPNWAPLDRKFYTAQDRPPLGALVHNLEHGYSILWYDEALTDDKDAIASVEGIAEKFEGDEFEDKFIAAPWTAADGEPFPDGAKLALTHWSMGGTNGNPKGQHGITQYCEKPSGEVVADFVEKYPYTDAPEPQAS
jgi:Protein of unknown function (DUF3105)